MPALSGSTKKVSVYGRKAEVRVVNRHSTFTSLENDENDPFGFFKAQPKPKINVWTFQSINISGRHPRGQSC